MYNQLTLYVHTQLIYAYPAHMHSHLYLPLGLGPTLATTKPAYLPLPTLCEHCIHTTGPGPIFLLYVNRLYNQWPGASFAMWKQVLCLPLGLGPLLLQTNFCVYHWVCMHGTTFAICKQVSCLPLGLGPLLMLGGLVPTETVPPVPIRRPLG